MKIPFWIVAHLGSKVQLSKPFNDGINLYPAGSKGTLLSIQAGSISPYATVILDGCLCQSEENFVFSALRPA